MSRGLLQQALEALEMHVLGFDGVRKMELAIEALEAELAKPEQSNYSDIVSDGGLDPRNKFDAQPEQEPVAWMVRDQVDGCRYPSASKNPAGSINGESQPLYTAPSRKEWVGLTDEELNLIYAEPQTHAGQYARAIEAMLKEKNK